MQLVPFLLPLLLAFSSFQTLSAQAIITIEPYLQDATPHSIFILWETDSDPESIVEWGLTDALGSETIGTSYPSNNGDKMIHEVQLVNLERYTKYYYKVRTGTTISEILSFKTPPLAKSKNSFRFLAMSDMQRDGAFPDKFREVVEDGVITYLEEEFGGDLVDNLALVMIPGDLVQSGNNFASWQNTFFEPAEKLFSHVPVYPVPGNHENNSAYFFTYFKLPDNGTPGFEEHWWFQDYGNVRIIGMDSNSPYDDIEQLDWLDDVLTSICNSDSIDFVFAQLHHPHKSELWTPGESDFTGEVIERLEEFSTACGKPSIHFFGHTHGYSRGQSRDHKHLWINVATAGGAIDNWGEFPNFDYDEFSVSQDEYGFVLVEISDDEDPELVVKRISRGDQDVTFQNQLRDSLTIRLNPTMVDKPLAIYPVNEGLAPECVTLKANKFSSPNQLAEHGQSHWQVDESVGDFSQPVFESWKNFENWYFEVNTQDGDDLTDESIISLSEMTSYKWRVRYRDKELNWSEWSDPSIFSTTESIAPPNLLLNSGAEDSLSNWIVVEGVVESLVSNVCDGVPAYEGERYFIAGGLCQHSAVGRAVQNINVSSYADSIDADVLNVSFGGYLSNFGGSDQPEMKLLFLDDNGNDLAQSSILTTLNSNWTMLGMVEQIPNQTRIIQVEIKGTRNAGTDNDSYFDKLYLRVGSSKGCDTIVSPTNQPLISNYELEIFPNPTSNIAKISLPELLDENFRVYMTDMSGGKISPVYQYDERSITIHTEDVPKGSYVIWVRSEQGFVGVGKLIVVK